MHSIPPIQYELCMTPACYQFVCANYIEQRWDVSAFTVLFSASLSLSLFLFLFLSFNYFYFYLSLSLSLSLSVFPPLFVCLSVFSYVAKERSSLFSLLSLSASRKGGIGDGTMEESLTITDSKTMFIHASWSPFFLPVSKNFVYQSTHRLW